MNILIYNWRDPKHPLAGGAEQMVLEHAKYWLTKGAKVTWFASGFEKAKKKEIIDGIQVIRAGSHFTVFLYAFFYYQKLKRKPDLIVDCFHFIPYLSHLYAPNLKKIAIIQEVAGKLWFDNLPRVFAYLGYIIEPIILRFYKNVPFITGSDSAKRDLLKLGFKKKNVTVINHGINRIEIKNIKKEKKPTLIFLGRISKDKGIEDAIKVISILKRRFESINFWVVGKFESDEYKNKIINMVRDSRIEENCKWFGFVDQKEKFGLLSKSWILIHPSKKEGWGLNVIEANSVGTLAVGYKVGGLTDSIVHGVTGLLVSPNVGGLVKGIENILSDKKIASKLEKNALDWSRKFTWENAGQNSWELIKKI